MSAPSILAVGLLLGAITTPSNAQDLIPAGSINDAASGEKPVIVFENEPEIRRQAEELQKRFFSDAELVDDAAATEKSLASRTVIICGTPDHAWLEKHNDRLPVKYQNDAVIIEGERFEGANLRVICAIRNPEDPDRRALLFTAMRAEDVPVPGVNSTWPWEWVVSDGKRILAARWFRGPPLTVEQMTADLDELVAKIRSVHPATVDGLPEDMETAVKQAREALTKPLRRDEFWLVLNRVMCALHDAHSNVNARHSGELLDMPFIWTSEGIIITKDAGPLRKGDLIVRLGDHTESQLLELLRAAIPAENEHWLRHRAERILTDLGVLRTLNITAKAPVPITVERECKLRKVLVPLAVIDQRENGRPWVRYEIDEKHDLGVFILDQCIYNEHYRKKLDEFFKVVREKNISRVAVDVRRNTGGNSSVVNQFLRYLDVEKYTKFASRIRLSPEVRKARVRQGNFGALFAKEIQRNPHSSIENRRIDQPFRGEVFILTSQTTFSSGNWFAVIFQDNQIGKVFGEPTGNGPSRPGDVLPFQLTHSGLSYGLSHKYWIRPDPERDPADTLTPDEIIPLTRRDIIEDRDPVLEYLRNNR